MRVWVRYPWQVAYPAVLETTATAAPLKIREALSACERRRSSIDEEEQNALAALGRGPLHAPRTLAQQLGCRKCAT